MLDITNYDVGIYIKARLKKQGKTVQNMADDLSLAKGTLDGILSGRVANPSILTVAKMVDYVGGSLDQLFGFSSPDATGHLDVALQERERTTEAYAPLLSEAQDDRREAYQQHVASLMERIAALVADKKRLFRLTMVLAAVLFVVLLAVIALFIHDFKNPDAGWITRSILHRLGLYTAVG